MASYTYKCENESCPNHYEFTIEASMKEKSITNCNICGCKVDRVFKSNPMIKWNCSGNYGMTKHT